MVETNIKEIDPLDEGNSLDDCGCGLEPAMIETLRKQKITKLFPIQKLVIPEIIHATSLSAGLPPRDLCVSAPTGSGKTLCYVLPLVQALRRRRVRRIRALVVVPVVNLAAQVCEIFRLYAGADLKVVLITGKRNFGQECGELYETVGDGETATADVVVATPGRLLDHLRLEGGKFCLKFLRYLILDEADRLMNDFRTDWLGEIENAVYDSKSSGGLTVNRHRLVADNMCQLFAAGRMPLQKILLSATLSHNPEQLQQLNLFQPKYFNISGRSETSAFIVADSNVGIPEALEEHFVRTSLKYKPLAIYRLVSECGYEKTLCFVDKVESSRKLAHVLQSLGVANVSEFASTVNKYRMRRILERFQKNAKGVLICTDLMARGMDIDNVDCVINYDRPKALRTYVHRIGRTARAGAQGVAYTLLEDSELADFKKIFDENRSGKLKEYTLDDAGFEKYESTYKESLGQVKEKLEKEQAVKANKSLNFGQRRMTHRRKFSI